MSRIWSLPGGVHPAENKMQSLQMPLGEIPLPSELVYPLSQHIGAPAVALVEVGDLVLGGQKIADAKGFVSAAVHASTSGIVVAIEDRVLPHPSGMSGPCVVVQPDGQDQQMEFEECPDYLSQPADVLLQKIRDAGITGMGGAGFPASVKLNPRESIDTLIINGTECEPYITADDLLMQTRPDDVIKGTQLLAHLLGNPERVVIGVEDNKPLAIAALRHAALGTGIEVVSFSTKYPSGGEKQLIYILTGQEVPSGSLPASIGVVLQNVGTTVAAYEAVRFGKPLTERITTVVGKSLTLERNIRVKLGTPISHVLQHHGYRDGLASRLIAGGPMMGIALQSEQVPVIKSTNCILAPDHKEFPDPQPAQACIRCGMCAEACPAGLLPQQMYWYAQAEDYDQLTAHNINDCIECGACSFACPSSIPLVQYFRAGKGALRQQAVDKEKSDRSRQRFEFRQERIAKEEAEKEAKRQARKARSQAAKKAQAESTPVDQPTASQDPNDPVAKAIASAQKKMSMAPDEKLKANLESLRTRLTKAQQKLSQAEAEGADTVAALQTGVDKITQKIEAAEKELAELEPAEFAPPSSEVMDAAGDAIARAMAKAKANAEMSPQQKLEAQVESLQQRLAKAQKRLQKAEADQDENIAAFANAVTKTQEKLVQAQAELEAL